MGKAGRIACIITPMALTLASLICFLCVMVGQLGNNNKAPSTSLGQDLYFFKASSPPHYIYNKLTGPQADTSNFTTDPQTILDKAKDEGDKFNINNDLLDALTGAASSKELKDFYQVGLWSYCEGEKKDGVEKITYCSSSKTQFWFNPVEVWGLQNTSVQNVLGDDLQKGLNTYKKIAGWMNWAFIIATILTAAEFIVGFFAIFSRWGSLVTTILSTVSSPSSSSPGAVLIFAGFLALRHRRRRNRNRCLRRPDRRLPHRARALQHRCLHGQQDAASHVGWCRIQYRIRSLLDSQRVLLLWQELTQEDGCREDSVHVRACFVPGIRSAGTPASDCSCVQA